MRRGRPLERTGSLQRRTGIRPVSGKRRAENQQRRAMIAVLYPERPLCVVYSLFQFYPDSIPAEVILRCGRWADDVHEPLTRARGGSITDPGNASAPCRSCHHALTFTPTSELAWAYALGLLRHSEPVSKPWARAARAVT